MPAGRNLRTLPKAHLHAHLEGCFPLSALQALAGRQGKDFQVPASFGTVWEFFEHYGRVPALVRSHEDLAALCRAFVQAEASQGVLYSEPAIEPQLYAPRLGSREQVTQTILLSLAEASHDFAIEVGAMLTINTDENFEIADELATIAARHAGKGVTALGTAGFIEPGNLARYRGAARIAQAAGLPVVSHAGQTGGPDSIQEALDELGASRIAHGFRAVESAALVARLARERIVCDICPISNVRLGVVASLERHPAPELRAAGVPVTLNADDELWFSSSITDQYEVARSIWKLGDPAIAEFSIAGTLASGMSAATKARMIGGTEAWLSGTGQP